MWIKETIQVTSLALAVFLPIFCTWSYFNPWNEAITLLESKGFDTPVAINTRYRSDSESKYRETKYISVGTIFQNPKFAIVIQRDDSETLEYKEKPLPIWKLLLLIGNIFIVYCIATYYWVTLMFRRTKKL